MSDVPAPSGAETVISASDPLDAPGDATSWTGTLHPGGEEPATATFTFSRPEHVVPGRTVRPFLLAFLPAAMRIGRPVRVEGPVDQGTIDGLLEWQEVMAAWHPGVLRPVPIRAEATPAPLPTPGHGAITSFSGGVDSCFSVVRHQPPDPAHPPAPDHRRTHVTDALMVHGFDISIDDDATFARAFDRSRRILDGLGVRAQRLRTDVRRLEHRFPVDWETATHGIWLAAALACLEDGFEHVVIPSTYPYRSLRFPWSSTPLTDPLLGSSTVDVWHDGGGADKLDKVGAIASHPSVAAGVRVCWEGERLDRNCGRCFKCVSTQVCFWVNGVERPAAFDVRATIEDVRATDFTKDAYKRSLARRLAEAALAIGRPDLAAALGGEG
jgi:hypothetical protein